MSTIDQILSIGEAALRVSQLGLQVTAHNIANVNTPGYSRQELVLETTRPQNSDPGQIGTGVDAESIKRIYDQFLGVQIQQEVAKKGAMDVKGRGYNQVEGLFNGMGEPNLATYLDSFWSAWEELSLNPQGEAERQNVVATAGELASSIRSLYAGLDHMRERMEKDISIYVDRANELSQYIAQVNGEIQSAEASGQNANDLRDKRDMWMEELASLLDVQALEVDDGTMTVFGPAGRPLVMGVNYWSLELRESGPNQADILWMDVDGEGVDITDSVTTGSVGGALEMRDQELPRMEQRLEDWTKDLIWEVNSRYGLSVDKDNMPSSKSGSVEVPAGVSLNDPSLPFGARVQAGTLSIWLYDGSTTPQPIAGGPVEIQVDPSWTLEDLASAINTQSSGALSATINPDRTLTLSVQDTGSGETYFAIAHDDSNALASLGILNNVDFFEGEGASDIGVSEALSQDPSRVVAAGVSLEDGSLPSPGENDVALSLAALREEAVQGQDFSGSLLDGFSAIVSEVGMSKASIDQRKEYQELIVQQLQDQRSSISGVNLDEEMVNMMKYQWGYQAAAKIIQAGDEMLNTILQMV